jgi:hypothetical protein
MKRPIFHSIRPKDCKCTPKEICFVCRSEQSGCAYKTGPAYLHTWIEAVRINNKKRRKISA